MAILTLPVQSQETLAGTYVKSGNDLYFVFWSADPYPCNPRKDYDCYSTFYIMPNRYFSGDKPINDFVLDTTAMDPNDYLKLPIYAYIHSGISLSTTPFHDDFDSGIVGFAVSTRQNMADLGYSTPDWSTRAEMIIEDELATFQQYLNDEAKFLTLYHYNPGTNSWDEEDSVGSCYNIESDQDLADVFFTNATPLDYPDFESI